MDEDFLRKLKSISVKDVLTDQRPATSRFRSSRTRTSAALAEPTKPVVINRIEESPDEASGPILTLSELLSKQPLDSVQNVTESPDEMSFFKAKPRNEVEMGDFTRAARIGTAATTRVGTATAGNHVSKSRTLTASQETFAQHIPDLNDVHAEEILQTVATAPEMEAEKITSLKELDADLARLRTFSVVRGVDMRKLARFMLPEKKLVLDHDEDMRSITYEQLYSDLLPLINGKNLISFDFSSKDQRSFDSLPFLNEAGKFAGFTHKDGRKRTPEPQMLQKLKDYATVSVEKFGKNKQDSDALMTLPYLEDILRKARDKYEQKERAAAEKKGINPPSHC